jgi:uncharacterized protein (TIGR02246 family)
MAPPVAYHFVANRALLETMFPTPQAAEVAFYRAFQEADLEAMADVWAADDEIVCIHPMGPRQHGRQAVLESWAQILNGGRALDILLGDARRTEGGGLAVHVVTEYLAFAEGEKRYRGQSIATNVYRLGPDGWRMILHHASPMPETTAEPMTTTLH